MIHSYPEWPTPNIGAIRSPASYKILLWLEHNCAELNSVVFYFLSFVAIYSQMKHIFLRFSLVRSYSFQSLSIPLFYFPFLLLSIFLLSLSLHIFYFFFLLFSLSLSVFYFFSCCLLSFSSDFICLSSNFSFCLFLFLCLLLFFL